MFDTKRCDNQGGLEGQAGSAGLADIDVDVAVDEALGASLSIAGLVAELDRVASLLGAVSWDEGAGDGAGLGDAVVGLSRAKAKLEAAELAASLAFDRCGYWATVGARAPHAFVRRRRRMRASEAKRQFGRARKTEQMPKVCKALSKARFTLDHVDLFAHACSQGREHLFARDEAVLVAQGMGLSFKDFRQMIAYWIQRADEAIGRDGPKQRREGRRFHCSPTLDSTMILDGQLTGLAGTEFKNELDRLCDIGFAADWQTAKQRLGRQPRPDDLDRTPAQRRADALLEMARRSASTHKPGEPAIRDLTVRMDYRTFIAELATMAGNRNVTYPTKRCSETTEGMIVAPSEILDPTIALRVRRIVFDSDGQVLDYGRAKRLFDGALRAAILERDRECQDPWCETDATYCQIDHITEWEDGGTTTITNAQTQCGTHNRLKHTTKHQQHKHQQHKHQQQQGHNGRQDLEGQHDQDPDKQHPDKQDETDQSLQQHQTQQDRGQQDQSQQSQLPDTASRRPTG